MQVSNEDKLNNYWRIVIWSQAKEQVMHFIAMDELMHQ